MNNYIYSDQRRSTSEAFPSSLSDLELLTRLPELAARESEATASLIAHLAEFDVRRLYLGQACSSLFTYCTGVLHLSESQSYARIEAARVARKFPVVLEMLARGDLNLTTVGLLSPCLTEANHLALLGAARHRSKREVARIAADARPRPTVPDTVRKLPAAASASAVSAGAAPVVESPSAIESPAGGLFAPSPTTHPSARVATAEPLGSDRYKIQFTATADVLEKLRVAQDLLRHQLPDGNLDRVFDRALSALIAQIGRQKFAATGPRRSGERKQAHTAKRSRHLPAEVKRRVWTRDGGRCGFIGASDRRCRERGYLEFHHVAPYARGGQATVENIELRCRAHNQYEADLCFGTGSGPSWRGPSSPGASVHAHGS